MGRWFILLVFALSGIARAAAQMFGSAPVEVWSEQSPGSAKINVRQHVRGIYTLVIDFYEVENLEIPKLLSVSVRGDGTITTLRPVDPTKEWYYTFRSKWIPGRVNPTTVDSTFVYRLPIKSGEKRKIFGLRYGGKPGSIVNYNVLGFEMNRSDTIYAARKGVVISVVDEYDPSDEEEDGEGGGYGDGENVEGESGGGNGGENGRNPASGQEYNYIDVQHDDGTIARYGVIERGSTGLEPGRMVYAGMPLARAGTVDGERYQLRFHVYYQIDNLHEIGELAQHTIKYIHIAPVFATSAGEVRLEKGKTYMTN